MALTDHCLSAESRYRFGLGFTPLLHLPWQDSAPPPEQKQSRRKVSPSGSREELAGQIRGASNPLQHS